MFDLGEIRIYLPKYLSPETEKKLFEDLAAFPSNIDQRMYSSYGLKPDLIYQGDGLKDLLVVDLPSLATKNVPCLVLSNTCDIDPRNQRVFSTNILYSPLVNLEEYASFLSSTGLIEGKSLDNHLKSIRTQKITQIFYLPKSGRLNYEAIVFFDRIYTSPNDLVDRDKLDEIRLFSLSQYGHYMFLYKLSIHFTRMNEHVDRRY